MNVLIWHVHGSWTTAFVQGPHRYVIPVLPARGADGRGRARTWDWPASAVECPVSELADEPIDVVIVQRPHEEGLARAWLGGRTPGRDLPLVYLEHNAPQGRISGMRHPARDRDDVIVVHVTHTNARFWDTGTTATTVIEHGVIDPGHRFSGELDRAAVVVNEPVRRGRVVGTDLLATFAQSIPLDVFGMEVGAVESLAPGRISTYEDLPQATLHTEMARRRAYLHPVRWTSLGLSLIEAMLLGLPVVALATTEVPDVVPPRAGVVSNRIDSLVEALRVFRSDRDVAYAAGMEARRTALDRFGLDRFLDDWDQLLKEVAR